MLLIVRLMGQLVEFMGQPRVKTREQLAGGLLATRVLLGERGRRRGSFFHKIEFLPDRPARRSPQRFMNHE